MYPHQAQKIIEGLPRASFQARVYAWLLTCFGEEITFNRSERNHRFLEEALELVQSLGCTREDASALVNYVYDRPAGSPPQEVGGATLTLAAICVAQGYHLEDCGEIELARAWSKLEQIRAKQATKPKGSPLPGAYQSKIAVPPACDHVGFTYEKHGRYCPKCGVTFDYTGD